MPIEDQIQILNDKIAVLAGRMAAMPTNPAARSPSQNFLYDNFSRQIKAMNLQISILQGELTDSIPF